MTSDRDKKRLIRAKAQRERTSYVEARRRLEAPHPSQTSSSPLRTTPLLVESVHPAGFKVGLISVDQASGFVMLRVRASRSFKGNRSFGIRVGARVGDFLPLRSSGGGEVDRGFSYSGVLPENATELAIGLSGSDDQPEHVVVVPLSGGATPRELVDYERVAKALDEIDAARSADALLPTSVIAMSTLVEGLDDPRHYVTSVEHWARSSVLNVYHDSPSHQGTRLPGRFVAFDADGRRYDSIFDGGGTWGRGMIGRHRVVPRIASDVRALAIHAVVDGERGEQVAAVDLA